MQKIILIENIFQKKIENISFIILRIYWTKNTQKNAISRKYRQGPAKMAINGPACPTPKLTPFRREGRKEVGCILHETSSTRNHAFSVGRYRTTMRVRREIFVSVKEFWNGLVDMLALYDVISIVLHRSVYIYIYRVYRHSEKRTQGRPVSENLRVK